MVDTIRVRGPQGVAAQGERETVSYRFNWARWGVPSSPQFGIELESDGTDLTAQKMTGSPIVQDSVVFSPLVSGLDRNVKYRIFCSVYIGGEVATSRYEAYAFIIGDR